MEALTNKYWLTRIVLIRALGFVYAAAFLVALNQNDALIGEHGLTPATSLIYAHRAGNAGKDWIQLLILNPTIYWFWEPTAMNLNIASQIGLILSVAIMVMGSANMIIFFALWSLYFSIVSVGQRWYSFGWESQLLETGFLAIFMVPVLSLSRFPKWTRTPVVAVWGYRWLLFRIMIGAGMIKIRGDPCWRDLTCMHYHYQTQPVPNPLSVYFHNNFDVFHQIETLGNHFIELLCPIFILLPFRVTRIILGGVVQVLFQIVLIFSGNLAFLNWLTIVPAIMSFDDRSLGWLFSATDREKALSAENNYNNCVIAWSPRWALMCNQNRRMEDKSDPVMHHHISHAQDNDTTQAKEQIGDPPSTSQPVRCGSRVEIVDEHDAKVGAAGIRRGSSWGIMCIIFRRVTCLALTVLIGYISYSVVLNLVSPNQHMNIAFDPFRIVNSYGAFGSITKVRNEVILQGTRARSLDQSTEWLEFQFACKPGDINRRPCLISPYHLRIDWLMWFAAFQNYQHCPWLVHLADKLLQGDPMADKLLAPVGGNPFAPPAAGSQLDQNNSGPPTFVRAELYEYQFASLDNSDEQRWRDEQEGWEVGSIWKRRHVRTYLPAVEANNPSVQQFLAAHRMK